MCCVGVNGAVTMRTMCVLAVLGTAVISLCDLVQARCTHATRSKNTGGSCSFEHNYCGWEDGEAADDLRWELLDRFYIGQNSYIRVNFTGVSAGSVAHLSSPWLCATGNQTFGSLTFRYSIQKSDRCRLAVLVATEHHRKEVWETTEGTGIPFSEPVRPIHLQCSPLPFRIIFVAQKLTRKPCGNLFDEIAIDDVIYRDTFVTSAHYHDCTIFTNATVPHLIQDQGQLSPGVVISVVLIIIVAIVTAVVIAGILWQRKITKQREKTNQELHTKTHSMTNFTYMTNSVHFVAAHRRSSSGSDVIASVDVRVNTCHVVDSPRDSAIYSVPDDLDFDSSVTACQRPTGSNVPPRLPASPAAEQPTNRSSDVTTSIDVRAEARDVTESAHDSAIYSVPNDYDVPPSSSPTTLDSSGPASSVKAPPERSADDPRHNRFVSRYNKLVHHGAHRLLLRDTLGNNAYDHLVDRDQEGPLYTELSTEDNSSAQKGGAREERPEPPEGSVMESEYIDMNQVQSQCSAEDVEYENSRL